MHVECFHFSRGTQTLPAFLQQLRVPMEGRYKTVISCHGNCTLTSWQSRLSGHPLILVTFTTLTLEELSSANTYSLIWIFAIWVINRAEFSSLRARSRSEWAGYNTAAPDPFCKDPHVCFPCPVKQMWERSKLQHLREPFSQFLHL